jgi:hypothetical protein
MIRPEVNFILLSNFKFGPIMHLGKFENGLKCSQKHSKFTFRLCRKCCVLHSLAREKCSSVSISLQLVNKTSSNMSSALKFLAAFSQLLLQIFRDKCLVELV